MVTAVTSFGRSGLYDWLFQRATAVAMAAYVVFIVTYIAMHPNLTYEQWSGLFDCLWVRVFSLITLFSIVIHAWIGLWVVLTDYLTVYLIGAKATFLRIFAQAGLALVAVYYTVWGIEILWGL